METKSFEVFPAPIDNKNIMEDWLDDFMGEERIDLSRKDRRKYIFKTPLGSVLEISWKFRDNAVCILGYTLEGTTWEENVKFLDEFFLAKYEGMKTIATRHRGTAMYTFFYTV